MYQDIKESWKKDQEWSQEWDYFVLTSRRIQPLYDYIVVWKSIIVFKDVSTMLINLETQNNDKYFEWALFEALMVEDKRWRKRDEAW